jgi:hypothetical protein
MSDELAEAAAQDSGRHRRLAPGAQAGKEQGRCTHEYSR